MLGLVCLSRSGGERNRCLRGNFFRKMGRGIGDVPSEVRKTVCGMRVGACDDGIGACDFLEAGEGDFGSVVGKGLQLSPFLSGVSDLFLAGGVGRKSDSYSAHEQEQDGYGQERESLSPNSGNRVSV